MTVNKTKLIDIAMSVFICLIIIRRITNVREESDERKKFLLVIHSSHRKLILVVGGLFV